MTSCLPDSLPAKWSAGGRATTGSLVTEGLHQLALPARTLTAPPPRWQCSHRPVQRLHRPRKGLRDRQTQDVAVVAEASSARGFNRTCARRLQVSGVCSGGPTHLNYDSSDVITSGSVNTLAEAGTTAAELTALTV